LYTVIEDLANVASDLEQVATWLRDEICLVERRILRSGSKGRAVWAYEDRIDRCLESIDRRTGRQAAEAAARKGSSKKEKQGRKV
jgi:hypothetical protein